MDGSAVDGVPACGKVKAVDRRPMRIASSPLSRGTTSTLPVLSGWRSSNRSKTHMKDLKKKIEEEIVRLHGEIRTLQVQLNVLERVMGDDSDEKSEDPSPPPDAKIKHPCCGSKRSKHRKGCASFEAEPEKEKEEEEPPAKTEPQPEEEAEEAELEPVPKDLFVPKQPLNERDLNLVREYLAGTPAAEIAGKYAMSSANLHQIMGRCGANVAKRAGVTEVDPTVKATPQKTNEGGWGKKKQLDPEDETQQWKCTEDCGAKVNSLEAPGDCREPGCPGMMIQA